MKLLKNIASFALLVPLAAQATNGYFAHGYSLRSKSMAGVGTAVSQDSLAAAINPANLVFVDNRTDVELEVFSPHRNYSVQGLPTLAQGAFPLEKGIVYSREEYFLVPTLGLNYHIDGEQTLGLAIYGNGGMNTDYNPFFNRLCPPNGGIGTFCAGQTGIDLAQAFISPSYAHSFFNKRLALGIAPIFAIQTLRAEGLSSFAPFSSNPYKLSDMGRSYSYGAGFRVGGTVNLSDTVKFGASYKSRIYMTPFRRYSGLFPEQGDFDIPESFNFGLSWQARPDLLAEFDVEHISYSAVASVGNPMLPNLKAARLGDNHGAGFGWKDMTIFKFGMQWEQNEHWTWRGGFSYGTQPIPNSEVLFNILAPGVQEWHITGGFSHHLSTKDELSFGAMYSPSKTLVGQNPLSPSQTIDLQMYEFSLQAGWTHHF